MFMPAKKLNSMVYGQKNNITFMVYALFNFQLVLPRSFYPVRLRFSRGSTSNYR